MLKVWFYKHLNCATGQLVFLLPCAVPQLKFKLILHLEGGLKILNKLSQCSVTFSVFDQERWSLINETKKEGKREGE